MLGVPVDHRVPHAFLRRQLDDPELTAEHRCGRCDNCTGPQYASTVDAAAAESARAHVDASRGGTRPAQAVAHRLAAIGVELSGRIPDGPEPAG